MSRKAVDIVLLPDEAMSERAIRINEKLVEEFGSKIVLNKDDCLPHISLAMGCIEQGDLVSIEEILKEIAQQCPVKQLT